MWSGLIRSSALALHVSLERPQPEGRGRVKQGKVCVCVCVCVVFLGAGSSERSSVGCCYLSSARWSSDLFSGCQMQWGRKVL